MNRLLRPEGASPTDTGYDGKDIALRRLVVFIDDLDRCTDEPTVRLLEAIKLYLQTRNCVFVFGMDGSAARRAVERLLPHGAEEAQEYLEKLFQATVHVPMPTGRRAFLDSLLEGHELEHPDLPRADLAELLDSLLAPNPRKLKNFLGALAVSWRVFVYQPRAADEASKPPPTAETLQIFVLLTYLRAYHPTIARMIAYDPSQAGVLHNVLTYCSETGGLPRQASPQGLLIHRQFHHAFAGVLAADDGSPRMEAVDDLVERLDRSKGDRAFVARWLELIGERDAGEVEALVRPMLHVALAPDAALSAEAGDA
ncbi:MAG: P-loop NTPase fold protein [Acidobacteriota bacterium]